VLAPVHDLIIGPHIDLAAIRLTGISDHVAHSLA
jgi:hypothetical protein